MIFLAIDRIQKELEANAGGERLGVKLGNIGEIVSSSTINDAAQKPIIISLINIEENRISRDPQNFIRRDTSIEYKNPAVNLYLTLLFTSVNPGYGFALLDIQKVIAFFQHKYVFDHLNTPDLDAGIDKLILEMQSFSLEQLQQLWSMLGGKYHPSIAYRMRMVTIDSLSGQTGSLVKEIDSNYQHIK